MTQYAPLDLSGSIPPEPGQARLYRLPTMNPGLFHLSCTWLPARQGPVPATGAPLPPGITSPVTVGPLPHGISAPGVIRRLSSVAPHIAVGANIGDPGGIGTVGPGGPVGGPTGPTAAPVLLDLYHGGVLVESSATLAPQTVTAANDDSWSVRVHFPSEAQPNDIFGVSLMPYTSTLPILTRRIPLDFIQQGFDNNWNGRNYISIVFEDSTLSVRFDPEIASYYHLAERDYPVATHMTEVPPNAIVQDIRLTINSSSGGYQEIPGPLPVILLAISIGGIGGQQMTFSIGGEDYELKPFSINVTFYITATGGYVEGVLQNVVGYRAEVGTDILEHIVDTSSITDPLVALYAYYKAHSYLFQTAIPEIEQFFNNLAGTVGAALTPWLLGAAYNVLDVRYDPTNSQPVPPSGPEGPNFVPQGDIAIDYIGLAEPTGSPITQLGNLRPPSLTITGDAPDGAIGEAYVFDLVAADGVAPFTWTTPGGLPAGVALAGASLSGTPSAQGIYDFQVHVTDASGATATRNYSVAVNSPGISIATPSPLPGAVVGEAYAVVLGAASGSGALKWSATGLPEGLAISPTGVISGTPTGDGSVATFFVQAVDAAGATARRALSLTILPAYLFDNVIYTPRGAGDSIWNGPPFGAPPRLGPGSINPGPAVDPGNLSKIDHIVVLMMENRSFDHMLGYLSKEGGRGDIEGLKWENDSNRTQFNFYNGRFYYPHPLTDTHLFNPESLGPDHSFESVKAQMADNMGHFVSDYAKNKIGDDPAQLSQVMGYYTAQYLPTYDMLAREFCVCDHWFCSHPGPTWPNRFVYLTGDLNRDSYGEPEVNTPLYSDFTPSEATTIFDLLTERKVTWKYFEQRASTMRAYTRYTFDMTSVLQYDDPVKGFAASVAAGLPSVTFVDPLFGDLPAGVGSPQDNDDAPPSDLADGQRFVAQVVSTLFNPATNANWLKTMLIVVYDEHGGFYDHVQPPSDALPLIGQNSGKLGPRVPAFVVSPYTPAGLVLKDVFEHTSIAATILRRFCGPYPPFLSPRVSAAPDLRDALPLSQARGQVSPILGPPTQEQADVRLRTQARDFVAPAGDDDFGSLLGAIALNLGLGGS